MSATLVVVLWLGTSASYLHLQPDLEAWARSRNSRIAAPTPPSTSPTPYDATLIEEVERLLERARIDWASDDLPSSRAALSQATRLIAQHPEWPQAAWLMAESLHQLAALHARQPEQRALVSELLAGARELEGSRAVPVVADAPSDPQVDTRTPPSIPVRQLRATDTVFDNGEALRPPWALTPGLHHLRVLRQGDLLWAGWHRVDPGATEVMLPVPPPAACSRADLGTPELLPHDDEPRPAPDVRCARWAVARPAPHGGVELALCERADCGPLRAWRPLAAGRDAHPAATTDRSLGAWPFVGAGAGVLALTGFILWQAGVFHEEREPETLWRIQGPPR